MTSPGAPPPPSVTAQTPAIDIRDLRVDYGNFVAVDDLTLQVPPGEVFGLVGPNGAGKTSTFRVLATLMEPTYGEVKLAGIDLFEKPDAARQIMGYMPDLAPVPSDLKVGEMLEYFARSHNIGNAAERKQRIDECLALTHLEEKRHSWCKALSRGQTQRAILAKTLLHRPKVLILDEPASGLDPLSRRHLRLILQKLAGEGSSIFISSHILSELAEMCTSLCVMNRGCLLAAGSIDAVREQFSQATRLLFITVLHRQEAAQEWLAQQPTVRDVQISEAKLTCTFHGSQEAQADLLTGLIQEGFKVVGYEERKSSFEDILVDIAQPPALPA